VLTAGRGPLDVPHVWHHNSRHVWAISPPWASRNGLDQPAHQPGDHRAEQGGARRSKAEQGGAGVKPAVRGMGDPAGREPCGPWSRPARGPA